jgi:hypothetical protein
VPPSKLSPLQEQVLIALSGLQPTWTLTGGAALAGFHTKHRETHNLDLFFQHETISIISQVARSRLDSSYFSNT